MLVIGLTGGIGSGKSTVAELFARRGAPIIDTDLIARELVEPGQAALAEIRSAFGDQVLDARGHLDRRRLRSIVFNDEAQRRRLEAILHPRIYASVRERIAGLRAPYCIVVIPLLVETGGEEFVDRVLVVDVPPQLQQRRTQARDGLSDAEAQAILASQADRPRRLAAADDVIENSGEPAALDSQVAALDEEYRRLGGTAP